MLTPDTKATMYATGAVGTTANRIAKGTITWGETHWLLPLPAPLAHLARSRTHSPSLLMTPCLVLCWALKTQVITDLPCCPQEAQAPRSTSTNPPPSLASCPTHTDPEGRHPLPKSL